MAPPKHHIFLFLSLWGMTVTPLPCPGTGMAGNVPQRSQDTLAPALEGDYTLEQLDNGSGISHSSVNTLFQDSDNLLWLGTWDGLNRYGGRNFKVFRPELNNPNSLSNQVILKVGGDGEGRIWALTMHGINRYDKQRDRFQRFYFNKGDKVTLTDTEFNMAFSPDLALYAYAKEWGIGYFDGETFQKIWEDPMLESPLLRMEFPKRGQLLFLDASGRLGFLQIAEKDGSIRVMAHGDLLGDVLDFRVLDGETLVVLDTTGRTALYTLGGQVLTDLGFKGPTTIIGVVGQGVVVTQGESHFLIQGDRTISTPKWLEILNGNKLTAILQGSEGIFWAATDGEGVFKVQLDTKPFHGVSSQELPGFDGTIVRSFLEVPGHSLWVGTKGKGVFRLSPDFLEHKNADAPFSNYNQDNSSLNNAVYSLLLARDSLVLLGTDGPGISIYDLKKERLLAWRDVQGSAQGPKFRSVYALYQDDQGEIWAGSSGYGLIRLTLKRRGQGIALEGSTQYLGNSGTTGELSSNMIYSIVPRDQNSLWVGTRLGGLNLFDKRQGSFEVHKKVEGDPDTLSNNDILCMHKTARGDLWVGTSFGLNVYGKDSTFSHYTVKDGLPNNTIHGISSDAQGNLWVSTNYGLSKWDEAQRRFSNYTKEEGLLDNEFGDGAAYAGSRYIFMGGRKGFNYFVPEQIITSTEVPSLFIDKIGGQDGSEPYFQSLVISPQGGSPQLLTLNHDQNFLNIEFSALSYSNNKKSNYAYQLRQFDPRWNQIGGRTNLSFTNVPPGEYSLWLKWSNGDGVWSEAVEAVHFRIAPIFWRSPLAWMLYMLLLGLFGLFVLGYYQKKQSLKRTILIREEEEKAHENKLDFFTNVAHELQTPLTLMMAPIQKLGETVPLDSKAKKYYEMLKRNASRLLFLTQQILEFRKAEDGHLKIYHEHFDLLNLVEQIAELFDETALKKNIDYKVDLPENLRGWFDRDLVEKIIFNLLSNAFKYTPDEGFIELNIQILEKRSGHELVLEIVNSGKGIPKEKLGAVFEKFYLLEQDREVGSNMFRTGIGLAFTKNLVQLLHGEISVVSQPEKHTCFRVRLPCSRENIPEGNGPSKAYGISSQLRYVHDLGREPSGTDPKLERLDRHAMGIKQYILVVEDDPEVQYLLEELLGEHYHIETASHGQQALECIKKQEPDLILSDVMMPVMDGIKLCALVKGNLDTCHIPFVMLTAKDSMGHKMQGIGSGANAYISKPFHPEYLLVRIQKLLEEKQRILEHFSLAQPFEELTDLALQDGDKAFVERLIALIRGHMENEGLQRGLLERELGLSATQLYRKTKELLGFSPGDLIRTMRLRHAAELLQKTGLTVSEVCYRSGFNNRSYFYREFKKIYHRTPKEYQLYHKGDRAAETTPPV